MKIGIIGSGSVGSSLGALLEGAGHDVLIGSRSHPTIKPIDAMQHGEVIILAIHFHVLQDFLKPSDIQEALKDKIVVDSTNPLNNDWSPLLLGQETSAGEEVAKLLPNSKVVKAFHTIFADMMKKEIIASSAGDITAFVASDDPEAMHIVAGLAKDCGFEPTTIAKLSASRYLEAMAHLNIELAVGQGGGTGAYIGYHRVAKEE